MSTAQALANTYRYDPWGQTLAGSGTTPNTLRFTAARRDATSGYAVMGQRSYDWGVGRFSQPDPLPSSVTDLNRYASAGCNPTNRVDPTGTQDDYVNACIRAPSMEQLAPASSPESSGSSVEPCWELNPGPESALVLGATLAAPAAFGGIIGGIIPGCVGGILSAFVT